MRNFLTFVAIALVTALTVALIAPPFIDWSARRALVAHAIAARIGAPVAISGPVTLRLLPTPYLQAAEVAIGPRGAPWLKAPAMRFEIAFANLIGGKIRLDDVVFDRPQIRIGPALRPPPRAGWSSAISAPRTPTSASSVPNASPIVLTDLNFDGSAPSAQGPWRGGGDFAIAGGRADFQLATGDFAGDTLAVKADVSSGATRAEFDGRLVLAAAPAFAGALTLSGEAEAPQAGRWPWRIAGEVAGQGDAANMADAEIRLGAPGALARGERPAFADARRAAGL